MTDLPDPPPSPLADNPTEGDITDPVVHAARLLGFVVEAAWLDDSPGVSESERARAGALVGFRWLVDSGIVTLNPRSDWKSEGVPGAEVVRAEFRPMAAPPDWWTNAPPSSAPFTFPSELPPSPDGQWPPEPFTFPED